MDRFRDGDGSHFGECLRFREGLETLQFGETLLRYGEREFLSTIFGDKRGDFLEKDLDLEFDRDLDLDLDFRGGFSTSDKLSSTFLFCGDFLLAEVESKFFSSSFIDSFISFDPISFSRLSINSPKSSSSDSTSILIKSSSISSFSALSSSSTFTRVLSIVSFFLARLNVSSSLSSLSVLESSYRLNLEVTEKILNYIIKTN